MTEPRVRLDDLGAWLIKGNADLVDLTARFAPEPLVTSWCVRPGYRARLMRAGQPVVFWASGSRARLPYGVWGVGRVTGAAEPGAPGPALVGATGPAHPRRTATGCPARVLRADDRLADLEVFRQPQAANPSYLTVAQFAALRTHLPE